MELLTDAVIGDVSVEPGELVLLLKTPLLLADPLTGAVPDEPPVGRGRVVVPLTVIVLVKWIVLREMIFVL